MCDLLSETHYGYYEIDIERSIKRLIVQGTVSKHLLLKNLQSLDFLRSNFSFHWVIIYKKNVRNFLL